jgi:hypothetical protein
MDNETEIVGFQVTKAGGSIITLPDIRTKHCFLGKENQILLGWTDGSDNYTTGAFYEVTGSATLKSVWVKGVEIYDEVEFNGIRDNLNDDDIAYKLMRNIDLAGTEYSPIGDENELFTGRLFGNGYRIDNLTIDNGGSVAGIFGAIGKNAEIYDLSINLAEDGISLTAADKDKAAGALAGYIKYNDGSKIIIKNVRTSGGGIKADNCSLTSPGKYLYVGGLVGGAIATSPGDSAQIFLDNISNRIPVSVELSADCHARLGGIIGETGSGSAVFLTSAKNYGNIDLKDTTFSGDIEVTAGGFIGRSAGDITIERGTNEGAVTVDTNSLSAAYSGGIAGYVQGRADVKNSYNNSAGNIFAEADGDSYSGGIAGYLEGNSSIDNCSNKSADNITAISKGASTFSYSGGIVGSMNGGGTITNSHNYDNVTATSTSGEARSGGIVGRMKGGGTITNSHNYDNVTTNSFLHSYSGGIVGHMLSGEIENSNNTGKVSGKTTGSGYVAYSGGIAGYMSGSTVKNSHNADNVTSTAYSGSYSGGIAGFMVSSSEVTMSYNTGKISAYGSTSYSGGIAGDLNSGTISSSYNTEEVKATATGYNSYSGGIAGFSRGPIENSYNTGEVNAAGTGTGTSYPSYSGGIAGRSSSTIKNSYNKGNVTATSSNSNVYVGGISGYNSSTVTNCAAVNSSVIGIGTYIGRIIGANSGGSASNNFAYELMEVNGNPYTSVYNSRHGYNKDMALLQDPATYADDIISGGSGGLGWQFCDGASVPCDADHPWKMPSGSDYPILYWQ